LRRPRGRQTGSPYLASLLQIRTPMKHKMTERLAALFARAAFLSLAVSFLSVSHVFAQVQNEPRTSASVEEDRVVARFEARVKEYAVLRERLEDKLPKLAKDATPEQIKAHKARFEEIVREARPSAKQGDLFTEDVAEHIRKTIRTLYTGEKLKVLREEIMEAETEGVPLRVNYTYPDSKELTQIPPTLLLKLPQLPKQVKYRFVGTNLLLVDRENGLIVDYMTSAWP
jgi:Skp family chaperone for outer membrane proteins